MSNSFTGILTTQAISHILSLPNSITITSFGVSQSTGDLDPSRTAANTMWYNDIFASPGIVDEGTITVKLSIPPSTEAVPLPDGNLISEIYLFAQVGSDPEYLFAIIHPPYETPIVYSNVVNYVINLQTQFSSGNVTGIFNFIYNPLDIVVHDEDPNAHQGRWVLKTGDSMSGALHLDTAFTTLTSVAGALTLTESSNCFSVLGSEAISTIQGWTKGVVSIKWDTVRTLVNSSSLILILNENRTTSIGDVGHYLFDGTACREIFYAPVGDYAKRSGDTNKQFDVASASTSYNAVNYGQLTTTLTDYVAGASLIGTVVDSFFDLDSEYYADMSSARTLSRPAYPTLYSYAVVNSLVGSGKPFGSGDGSTTFTTPVIKGQVIVAYDSSDSSFNSIGKTGGEKNHTLTTNEMPRHGHGVNDPGHEHTLNSPVPGYTADSDRGVGNSSLFSVDNAVTPTAISSTTGITIQLTGGGQAHNNLQPYLVLKKFLRLK